MYGSHSPVLQLKLLLIGGAGDAKERAAETIVENNTPWIESRSYSYICNQIEYYKPPLDSTIITKI